MIQFSNQHLVFFRILKKIALLCKLHVRSHWRLGRYDLNPNFPISANKSSTHFLWDKKIPFFILVPSTLRKYTHKYIVWNLPWRKDLRGEIPVVTGSEYPPLTTQKIDLNQIEDLQREKLGQWSKSSFFILKGVNYIRTNSSDHCKNMFAKLKCHHLLLVNWST